MAYAPRTLEVSGPAQTSAYRSIPARVSSRASAAATASCRSAACGTPFGSAHHRNSCNRSSEIASRPPPAVSERSAARASSATAGSSRARVCSASASVIMRSVCPTKTAGGRCVVDLASDVRVAGHTEIPVAVRFWRDIERSGRRRPPGPRRPAGCGMIAGVSGIYDEPELYQLACAYRDVPAESSALLTWLDKHATIPDGVRSVIELAAGPARDAGGAGHPGPSAAP